MIVCLDEDHREFFALVPQLCLVLPQCCVHLHAGAEVRLISLDLFVRSLLGRFVVVDPRYIDRHAIHQQHLLNGVDFDRELDLNLGGGILLDMVLELVLVNLAVFEQACAARIRAGPRLINARAFLAEPADVLLACLCINHRYVGASELFSVFRKIILLKLF